MTSVKFSVIIPCFNDGSRIRRSVESCLNQTYLPYEVIIVDDGSNFFTQQTIKDIVEEYHSKGVRAFFLIKNRGVAVARNKGIDMASGDMICFLDSDDVWHPDKLKIAANFLTSINMPIALAHDFTYNFDDLSKRYNNVINFSHRKISTLYLILRNPITAPSLMIPTGLNIKYDERMTHAEDHDFLLRLSQMIDILILDIKLVFINRKLGTKGGLSGDKWKMRKGEIKMFVNLCASRPKYYLFLPALVVYSITKHVRSMVLSKLTA